MIAPEKAKQAKDAENPSFSSISSISPSRSKIPAVLKLAAIIIGMVSGIIAIVFAAIEIIHLRGAIMNLQSVAQPYVGDLKYSVFPINDASWLICEGQEISRTTYSDLFAVLDVTFGQGDSNTTFNAPDFRGRVAGMVGAGSGLTPRLRGEQAGVEAVQLTIDEMPSHTHDLYSDRIGADGANNPDALFNQGNAYLGSTAPVGGDSPHTNMQPTLFAGAFYIYAG